MRPFAAQHVERRRYPEPEDAGTIVISFVENRERYPALAASYEAGCELRLVSLVTGSVPHTYGVGRDCGSPETDSAIQDVQRAMSLIKSVRKGNITKGQGAGDSSFE